MSVMIRTFVALLVLASTSSVSLAHAQLQKAVPPVGGTVAPPSEIRLQFSEAVEPRFSKVTLTDPRGAGIALGALKTEGAVLIVRIGKRLTPGDYMVHWRAVSVDTHRTQGAFSFIVK